MRKSAGERLSRRGFLKCAAQLGAAAPFLTKPLNAYAREPKPFAVVPPLLKLNVRDFGATGDGTTLETSSLQRAIDRCNVLGGGEVIIPAGGYLTGGISLRTNVTLRLDENAILLGASELSRYEIAQVRWEGKWIAGYTALLHALDAQNIAILGKGEIRGNVAVAGRPTKENPLRRPALIEFIGCDGVHLDGFSTSYAHMWSIHPTYCDNVTIRNVTVRSTETNGDGIDIDSCRHVLIDSCDIASGDDCISLKSGRGEEAYIIDRPTENVRIINCTLEGRGYACIGIGSETSAGIRDVLIEHCRIKSVYKDALYIKSRVGRGAFIENITVRDLDAANMRVGFLRINQTNAGIQDPDPVPGLEGVPLFRNFRFQNIRLQHAPVLLQATEISPDKMLDGLVLQDISGTCAKGMSIANARNVLVREVSVTGYKGPLLTTANVTGRGIAGATAISVPAAPAPVPSPAAQYELH
jgi:hypothetical protein